MRLKIISLQLSYLPYIFQSIQLRLNSYKYHFLDRNSTSSHRWKCFIKTYAIHGRDEKGNSLTTKGSFTGENKGQSSKNGIRKPLKRSQVK